MPQDVSVKSLDMMKGYNSRIKAFNTSANTLIYAFRHKIEDVIAEEKQRLSRLKHYYSSACEKVDNEIRKVEDLLHRNNWHPESEAKIQCEIMRLKDIRKNLDTLMSSVEQHHSTLSLQLDQIIQSATTFGLSNQNLLNGSVHRMDNAIQYIDKYNNSSK